MCEDARTGAAAPFYSVDRAYTDPIGKKMSNEEKAADRWENEGGRCIRG
jgi:hypothetical protein